LKQPFDVNFFSGIAGDSPAIDTKRGCAHPNATWDEFEGPEEGGLEAGLS